MPLATEAGRYLALPSAWNVTKSGPNKLFVFECSFRLMQRFDADSEVWISHQERDEFIRGFFYLQCRDGSANASVIRQVREALGWNGINLAALQGTDHKNTQVELIIENEEYAGRVRPRIKWLNRIGRGTTEQSDDATIEAMQAEFGDQLRALADEKVESAASNESAAPAATLPVTPPPIANNDIPF